MKQRKVSEVPSGNSKTNNVHGRWTRFRFNKNDNNNNNNNNNRIRSSNTFLKKPSEEFTQECLCLYLDFRIKISQDFVQSWVILDGKVLEDKFTFRDVLPIIITPYAVLRIQI
jgi:hypothetical protein